jgi:hypothetical protein
MAPVFANLGEEAHNLSAPRFSAELENIENRLDGFASNLGRSPDPVPVLDFKFHPSQVLRADRDLSLLWPPGLFIPGNADFHDGIVGARECSGNCSDYGFSWPCATLRLTASWTSPYAVKQTATTLPKYTPERL